MSDGQASPEFLARINTGLYEKIGQQDAELARLREEVASWRNTLDMRCREFNDMTAHITSALDDDITDRDPDKAKYMHEADIIRLRQRTEAAEAKLAKLQDLAREMLPYVPEYFRDKWGYDEELVALLYSEPIENSAPAFDRKRLEWAERQVEAQAVKLAKVREVSLSAIKALLYKPPDKSKSLHREHDGRTVEQIVSEALALLDGERAQGR